MTMADAKRQMENELEKLLECTICLNIFTKPLFLPCMHTFCCDCIREYVQKLQKDGTKASEFNCPTCRRRVDIPEGGVEQLPKHLFVDNLKDVLATTTKSETKCDYCTAMGAEASALWRCIDCCHSLCDTCKEAHDRVHSVSKKLHTLMKFDEWKHSDFSEICYQSKEMCADHEDIPLQFFCSRCDLAICQTCHTLNHNDHKCKDLKEVVEEAKGGIQDSIKNIAKLIKQKEDEMKELTQCNDTLVKSHNDVIRFIREQKSIFMKSVSKHFDDIGGKACQMLAESQKIINVNLDCIKSDISSLKSSNQIGDAVHSYGRNAEIVDLSKRLLKIIKSQEECVLNINQIKRSLHILNLRVNKFEMREGLFGVCEKRRLFPDLQTATNEDTRVCGPVQHSVAPSVRKIKSVPNLITRLKNKSDVRSLTCSVNDGYDVTNPIIIDYHHDM